MLPQGANRTRWLLGIAAGLSVGVLDAAVLAAADALDVYDEAPINLTVFYVVPALFAVTFLLLLRSVQEIRWWAGLVFVLGIAAAHRGAFVLAVASAWSYWDLFNGYEIPAFVYGATVGAATAGLSALVSSRARHVLLFAGTVLAGGIAALSFVPLDARLGDDAPLCIAFSLVDGAIAAVLGLRLFAGDPIIARNSGAF